MPVLIALTHEGMARLSGLKKYRDGLMIDPPKVVTYPSTNRAQCSLTLLIWPLMTNMPLPMHQTGHQQKSPTDGDIQRKNSININ